MWSWAFSRKNFIRLPNQLLSLTASRYGGTFYLPALCRRLPAASRKPSGQTVKTPIFATLLPVHKAELNKNNPDEI